MSIAIDTSNISATIASGGTHSHTVSGTDRLMVAMTTHNRSGLAVSYNSVAMTSLGEINVGGVRAGVFYLVAPDTGIHDISWTMDSAGSMIIASISLTGVDQTIPIGATATEQEIATSTNLDITLQYPNSWTIENQSADGSSIASQDSGQDQRQEAHPAFSLALATKAFTSPGTQNLGFSMAGNTQLRHYIIEVVEVGAPGAGNMLIAF